MLDSDAYTEWADSHIKWCEDYSIRMDWDWPDWKDRQYYGQQFSQRRREAEKRAAEIYELALGANNCLTPQKS